MDLSLASFPTEFSCKRFALQVWADQWQKLILSASISFFKETKLLSKIFFEYLWIIWIFLDILFMVLQAEDAVDQWQQLTPSGSS